MTYSRTRDPAQSRRSVLVLACLAFAAIFAARLAFPDLSYSVSSLFVLPIAVLAAEYGVRGGTLAALVGIGLVALLDAFSTGSTSTTTYVTRTASFLLIGWLVGLMAHRLRAAVTEANAAARHFALVQDMLATAKDGYFVDVNPSFQATLGWTPEELRSRPFVDFVHPDDRERTEAEAARVADGHVTVSFVNRYRTKAGDWRWIEWSARLEPEEQLVYAAARDITERRRTEQARRDAEERFRRAFEDSAVGMAVLDATDDAPGRVLDANDAFCRLLGFERADLVGTRSILELALAEDAAEVAAAMPARGEGDDPARRSEFRVVHADGATLWVDATTSLVRDDEGRPTYWLCQLLDVDARKSAEQALRDAADQALEASRMKSDFVANMSHEIRTPLNGVIGMADLLLETEMSDEQRGYAEALHVSADALMAVIDDILDFSKIEAGKLEIEAADFAVRDLLSSACAVVAQDAAAKGVELIAWCDPRVPHAVRADGARIRQVLTNLLGNAVKFTSEGEIVVRVERDEVSSSNLRIAVSDTGIGIAPEALGTLFDAFAQADTSTTRRFGGSGLGLAISRQLVELMGGAIGVESEVGAGSTFWFTVPVAEVDGAIEISRPVALAGIRALVVDDNATNRSILASQLASWGMSCDSAAGAKEALALMEEAARGGRPYGLSLIDFHMPPGRNGVELAAAIRANARLRGMRVIILSSAGAGRAATAAVEIDGFLTKPVVQNELRAELVRVMGSAREHAARPDRAASASGADSRRAAGPRVLVAEDNPVNQRVVVSRLESLGCRVDLATDGREAVEMSARAPYAAIFMDIQMPVMDGYAATDAIRRREGAGPRTPIIAVTAHSIAGDAERCLAAGMDDYVSKPVRAEALGRMLERWVFASDPVLDPAALEDTCGDDTEARDDLVKLFLEHSAGELEQLREALAAGDLDGVRATAHSLSGSAGTLGAVALASACGELSKAARAQETDGLGLRMAQVEQAYEATSARLAALIGARSSA